MDMNQVDDAEFTRQYYNHIDLHNKLWRKEPFCPWCYTEAPTKNQVLARIMTDRAARPTGEEN